MYHCLASADVPILLSRGFTYGMTQDILWSPKTSEGKEFQVVDDGRWLLFGERRPNGCVNSHVKMTRNEFYKLF